ncbi:MFS transporter [Nocardioides humilatus]|uniref:Multidrug efflux pump Tap n=1 Tax=Nocardioides humilatus TaxID=2607660 RepID=A0A5B1L5I3_9ACTN|nr:MFS transporter [Nocardioides humilatus]KAA1415418.1 MFS transporter [Nocardioides humilatus]
MSHRRPLYGWLGADAVSLIGTRVSMIAIPWFVLTTTGSATQTGLVALAEMLPLVVLKVLGGPIIDRLGARRVAITCDLASVVVVGAIPLLHHADLLTLPVLLVLVAGAGALRGPGDAAKHSLVPRLAETAQVPMERVTGLGSTVERTATLVGAGLAGALVSIVGAANAIAVDAASFGLSAGLLAWATMSMRPVAEPDAAETERTPYLHQLRQGWDFLRSDPLLLGIAIMVALNNLLDVAWATVLMPVWAQEYGAGAAGLGLYFAVFAGASAIGSICAAAWGARLPRYPVYLVAFLITGAPRFVVLAYDSPLWLLGSVVIASGFASGFLNPVLGAVIFERIPAPLVGRVSSLTTAMCFALMPFGGLVGGALVSWQGLSFAMLAVGATYFLVTIAPALSPRWKEMNKRAADLPQPG